MQASHRAIEDADACLNIAGLPTFTELIHALVLMMDNSGNVHATECTLFAEHGKPCNCALGVARATVEKYRDATRDRRN